MRNHTDVDNEKQTLYQVKCEQKEKAILFAPTRNTDQLAPVTTTAFSAPGRST
jgi:hypothetical protein